MERIGRRNEKPRGGKKKRMNRADKAQHSPSGCQALRLLALFSTVEVHLKVLKVTQVMRVSYHNGEHFITDLNGNENKVIKPLRWNKSTECRDIFWVLLPVPIWCSLGVSPLGHKKRL